MTDMLSAESHATALSANASEITYELTGGAIEKDHPMADAANAMGLTFGFGTIAFVGRDASGDYLVQFNDTASNTGYSSSWPGWAYEVAKAALENAKNVWVESNGPPFGGNLVFVLEMA
jgi:hypothetical protein